MGVVPLGSVRHVALPCVTRKTPCVGRHPAKRAPKDGSRWGMRAVDVDESPMSTSRRTAPTSGIPGLRPLDIRDQEVPFDKRSGPAFLGLRKYSCEKLEFVISK